MAKTQGALGATELAVLRYIADRHPITVGEAAEHFSQTLGLARTTVLTVMERLRRKGRLQRELVEGVYRYTPQAGKETFFRRLVQDFVDAALGGSVSPLVSFLAEDAAVSDDDVEKLKRLAAALEAKRKGNRS